MADSKRGVRLPDPHIAGAACADPVTGGISEAAEPNDSADLAHSGMAASTARGQIRHVG